MSNNNGNKGDQEYVDWNVDADANNIRPGSIELQRIVHKEWHEKIKHREPEGWLKSKPVWRVRCIEKLEVLLGTQIFGEVLEIGAGTALCSALAAKRSAVERVTAMDYDVFCVTEMMPTVFEKFDAPTEKLRRALGSYNNIPEKEAYDFVIGVGALHHAESLSSAFEEIFSALKPGGIALISDVCEYDSTGTRELTDRYNSLDPDGKSRYGRDVQLKDNGDHWYRFSEWLTASRNAGFEVLPYLFDNELGEAADDGIFKNPKSWRGYQIRVFQPFFSDRGFCDSLLLILQKPDSNGATPAIPDKLMVTTGADKSDEIAVNKIAAELNSTKEQLQEALDFAEKQKKRAEQLKISLNKTSEKLVLARRHSDGSNKMRKRFKLF